MKGFQQILVPLDFSDSAEEILGAALRVLGSGGTITLLHVVEWLPAVTGGTFGIYPHRRDIEKIKELAGAKLKEMVHRHPEANLEALVREGRAAQVILETIGERKPDVVVMGSHGRSKLDQLLIGSVAERVIRHAPCAVLTVRF